jgi:hypothetical protein
MWGQEGVAAGADESDGVDGHDGRWPAAGARSHYPCNQHRHRLVHPATWVKPIPIHELTYTYTHDMP